MELSKLNLLRHAKVKIYGCKNLNSFRHLLRKKFKYETNKKRDLKQMFFC
jgi:hypothetical protein